MCVWKMISRNSGSRSCPYFEAFSRLDDSRTRASGGYGLGLSIVSRIAYWFGGSIQVDQSPTLGGARFIMTWPAQRYVKRINASCWKKTEESSDHSV